MADNKINMISHTELKKGVIFILNNQPWQVLESDIMFKGRGRSVVRAKIKNMITGNVLSQTFHQGQNFDEAEIIKKKVKFLYSHRDKYFFSDIDNPSNRFNLEKTEIGSVCQFLKPDQEVEALFFEGKVIGISLPIKMQFKVVEAPPGIQADRAEPGAKQVKLEGGAKITVPLFIKEGDIIEVNTEEGKYVRRIGN